MKLVKKELLHNDFFSKKNKKVEGIDQLNFDEVYDTIYIPQAYCCPESMLLYSKSAKKWIKIKIPSDCAESLIHLFEPV